jgi:hypothetical protein
MVNAVFEDRGKHPEFDPDTNTPRFIARIYDGTIGRHPSHGEGIPADAREKPGSGGQLIALVPSLDLVVTRQTGSSGDWAFEDYLRRACAAALKPE